MANLEKVICRMLCEMCQKSCLSQGMEPCSDYGTSECEVCFGDFANHLLSNGVTILPCKIGDEVWGISSYNHCSKHVKKGIVHEMFYGDDMRLCIAVKGVCRGVWGEKVFGTEEEALKALEEQV